MSAFHQNIRPARNAGFALCCIALAGCGNAASDQPDGTVPILDKLLDNLPRRDLNEVHQFKDRAGNLGIVIPQEYSQTRTNDCIRYTMWNGKKYGWLAEFFRDEVGEYTYCRDAKNSVNTGMLDGGKLGFSGTATAQLLRVQPVSVRMTSPAPPGQHAAIPAL